jgi:NADP-dependent aldehyde dehydrogenase
MLSASVLDSSGQQCTCPGILFVVTDENGARLARGLRGRLDAAARNVMLSRRVRDGYHQRVKACLDVAHVSSTDALRAFARVQPSPTGPIVAPAGLIETSASVFRTTPTLREEVFGPAALIVWCADADEMLLALDESPGSLTGTAIAGATEPDLARKVLRALADRAGRVILDGVPPGVRVVSAMVHGGPHPSTNRPDTTAVGSLAIERWTRPVCFQNIPADLLPSALRDVSAPALTRLIDGAWRTATS